jgi:hypothetical protein
MMILGAGCCRHCAAPSASLTLALKLQRRRMADNGE